MKIRLKADISGNRNGVAWPPRGSVVDLPQDEAAQMCRNGMAVPVERDDVETAMVADDSSKRGLTKASAGGLVPNQQDSTGALIPPADTKAAADDGAQSGDSPDSGDKAGGDGATKSTSSAPTAPAAGAARKPAAKKTAAKPPTGK